MVERIMELEEQQSQVDLDNEVEEIRKDFFRFHTARFGGEMMPPKVITAPHDLFKWFETKFSKITKKRKDNK